MDTNDTPTPAERLQQVLAAFEPIDPIPSPTRENPQALQEGDAFGVPSSLLAELSEQAAPIDLVVLSLHQGPRLVQVAPALLHGPPGPRDVRVATPHYQGVVFRSLARVIPSSLLSRTRWQARIPVEQLDDSSYEDHDMEMRARELALIREPHAQLRADVEHTLDALIAHVIVAAPVVELDSLRPRDWAPRRAASTRELVWSDEAFMGQDAEQTRGLELSVELREERDRLILHWRLDPNEPARCYAWMILEVLADESVRPLHTAAFEATPGGSGKVRLSLKGQLGGPTGDRDLRFLMRHVKPYQPARS